MDQKEHQECPECHLQVEPQEHCEICDITMPKRNMSRHLKSKKHRHAAGEEIEDENGEKSAPCSTCHRKSPAKTVTVECEACKIQVPVSSLTRHQNSMRHKVKAGEVPKPEKPEHKAKTDCEVCGFHSEDPAEFKRHLNRGEHRLKSKAVSSYCDACDKSYSNLALHYKSKKHQEKINSPTVVESATQAPQPFSV